MMQEDGKWNDVLDWVNKWCTLNNCTKYGFMRHYSLPIKDIGFLYYEIPSTRPTSLYGYDFRMKLIHLCNINDYEQQKVKETIQDKINDAFKTNIKQWRWDIHLDIDGNNIYIRHDIAKPGCLEKFLQFLFKQVPSCTSFPIINHHVTEQQLEPTVIITEFEYYLFSREYQ
jgi:hypothetical protein